MRLALLACLVVLMLAFAGCSGKGKGSATSSSTSHSASASSTTGSSSSSSSSSASASASSSTTGSANHPPTGSVSVSVNGTVATFNLTGSDADKDTLVWDLAFGDGNSTNGTTLPATASHNYTKAGNLTAQYTVTDGKSAATYNVTVHVVGAGGASQHVDGGFTTTPNTCATLWFGDLDGVSQVAFAVDAATIGLPFKATVTTSAPNAWVKIGFFDDGGSSVGGVGQGVPPTPSNGPDLTGTVPDGATNARMTACGGGMGTAVYDAGPGVA